MNARTLFHHHSLTGFALCLMGLSAMRCPGAVGPGDVGDGRLTLLRPTSGRLICSDDRPFSQAPVVVELRHGQAIERRTNVTDAAGNFVVAFPTGSLALPAEFRVHSTACPSEEWVFPTTNRFANLGQLVARQCTASVRPPPTMVLCLPFDDRPGPITANIVGGNSGTLFESNVIAALSGGPARGTGLIGGALRFDGLNDFIGVPSYPAVEIGTNEFSIMTWVRLEANEAQGGVLLEHFDLASLRGYSLQFAGGATNRLALQVANGSSNATYLSTLRVPSDGQWHHVAVTLRRSAPAHLQFYLDAVPDGAGYAVGQLGSLTAQAPLRIGASAFSTSNPYRGWLDELAVFRRALLPQEIRGVVRARANGLWLARACPPMTFPVSIPLVSRAGALAGVSTVPVSVNIEVCNETGTAREMCVTFGEGGPSPLSTGCLGPGQCVTLTVTVNVPASGGLTKLTYYVSPGACGSGSGYSQPHEVYVPAITNGTSTATSTTPSTSLLNAGAGAGTGAAAGTVSFGLTNLTTISLQYAYRMRVVNPNLVDVPGVQLTGITSGSGTLPANGSAVRSAGFRFLQPDPLVIYAVLLEVDWNDGLGYQAWISADLENPIAPTCQPSIAMNTPVSAYVLPGQRVDLAVSAASSQTPLTYRWRKNRIPILGSAAANPIFTIPSVSPAQEGAYDVIVMDGCGAVISQTAWVLLQDKVRLEIVRQGDFVELRWPERLGGFAVETTSMLAGLPWQRINETPTLQGGYYRLVQSAAGGALAGGSGSRGFYRLASSSPAAPTSNCD